MRVLIHEAEALTNIITYSNENILLTYLRFLVRSIISREDGLKLVIDSFIEKLPN